MKINLFDSHVHSDNSHDGHHSVLYLCEKARDNRIMGLCITDHFECEAKDIAKQEIAIKQSAFEVERARLTTFGSDVMITKGIELGQGQMRPDIAASITESTDFDFVIGSMHVLPDGTDYFYLNYDDPQVVISDILMQYYKDQYDMAVWNGFDTLGHLGYPERYIWGNYRIPVNNAPYREIIDETLKVLISNGKSLEVNTAGLGSGLGKTTADRETLIRYRELGGELITIGSDAHTAQKMGNCFDNAMDMLTSIGFRYFAFYRHRKPVMLGIL
ncbi:MAG: histidinol-phosphatase HisJ family protein [Angelakisella sp.]